ncbi:LysR family transcriptional regulator [Mycolicibacterium wolinskyi]|uniref:Probable hydrogen peroxide-inducible genes activator n=1 Tax=Mycolicibacterium wolinskyi TaxID=59750 RepID=A0A1X2FAU7_9MYCO|nr:MULTISPECIES: LysR substrate-binding domain-containing protein [Mycolicibacterium]MCV7285641.1 LysR family transcriptional regulator [Mycolicibacterium wolinskyi]MCV7291328.1 LysR family transcriptional regulator [Mycolicibacterium goodii]ORX15572.1 LysR family transcriptional regulator [Mycolicibacterium wolinskyi]
MELRQIEHFIAVAGEMSFTRAAHRAHVVQSALSTSIAKLERELGVELFDRSRQQIKLTAAGERFLTHSYDVMRAARAATESIGEYRGALSGTVEFGSLISFGPISVARALGDFHRAHPFVRIRLHLSQSGASAYLTALIEGSLDLALVSVPNRFPPQLDMRLLFEENMVFVCRDDHAYARKKRVGFAELAAEDLVGLPSEFGLRRLMDDAFRAAGAEAHTQYEVPAGFAAIADLVGNGLGTSFMPVSEARRFAELKSIDLADPVIWQVYLASPPAEQLTPATARLADTLLAAAEA